MEKHSERVDPRGAIRRLKALGKRDQLGPMQGERVVGWARRDGTTAGEERDHASTKHGGAAARRDRHARRRQGNRSHGRTVPRLWHTGRVNLEHSTAVITGAASGIGAATARMIASAGGRVVLGDVSEDGLARTAADVQRAGGEAVTLVTNVSKEGDVAALMDLAFDRFGGLNVVVPCAGIFRDAFTVRVKEGKVTRVMSLEDFQAVVNVNLTGTFLTLREAIRRMVDHDQKGVLFCVSSINKEGEVGQLNYSATKVAVGLWPKILVGELAAQGVTGIRIVGIAPGYVETPILAGMSDQALEKVLENVPLGRLIKTDEITGLIRHVVENDAIDGTTIEIAGGVLARGVSK